jgi:malonyl-CoA/methylmalonyl-CoA synthetase
LNRYAGDEEATRAAFDEEGYYKTGDLAEIRDGQYFFVGRANSDCVYRLSSHYTPAFHD